MSKKEVSISLKNAALSTIKEILVSEYKVSMTQASALIKLSGVEEAFNKDAELAAHTSYKTWAQRAYDYHGRYFNRRGPHQK